jgi:HEAT repeat protein
MKTLNQVRSILSDIEPSEKTFASLDPDDIPHLMTLLDDSEEWLAARAVHALSRLNDPRAHEGLNKAAADPRGAIRVAVATALPRLPAPVSERIMSAFLDDHDTGVRKFTLRALPAIVPAHLHAKIERMVQSDTSEPIRALAATVLAARTRRQVPPHSIETLET